MYDKTFSPNFRVSKVAKRRLIDFFSFVTIGAKPAYKVGAELIQCCMPVNALKRDQIKPFSQHLISTLSLELVYVPVRGLFHAALFIPILGVHILSVYTPCVHSMTFEPTGNTHALLLVDMQHGGYVQQSAKRMTKRMLKSSRKKAKFQAPHQI